MNLDTQCVILVSGLQFSGKTTIGHELAMRFPKSQHIDDDAARHALFPRSSAINQREVRRMAFRYVTQCVVGAAEINLQIGFSPILSSTFSHQNAKRPIEEFWKRWQDRVPFHFFELVIPEGRETVIHRRAVLRYGNNPDVVQQKLERREHVKRITAPWSEGINPMVIDATKSINDICKEILDS